MMEILLKMKTKILILLFILLPISVMGQMKIDTTIVQQKYFRPTESIQDLWYQAMSSYKTEYDTLYDTTYYGKKAWGTWVGLTLVEDTISIRETDSGLIVWVGDSIKYVPKKPMLKMKIVTIKTDTVGWKYWDKFIGSWVVTDLSEQEYRKKHCDCCQKKTIGKFKPFNIIYITDTTYILTDEQVGYLKDTTNYACNHLIPEDKVVVVCVKKHCPIDNCGVCNPPGVIDCGNKK